MYRTIIKCICTKKSICGAKHGGIPSCFAEKLTALCDDQPPKHCCYWQPGQQLASSVFLSPLYITSTCAMFYWSEVCVCVCSHLFQCFHHYVFFCLRVCYFLFFICVRICSSLCVSWHVCTSVCWNVFQLQHSTYECVAFCNSGCVCLCVLCSFLLNLSWPNKLFPTVPSLFWIIYWQPEVQNI